MSARRGSASRRIGGAGRATSLSGRTSFSSITSIGRSAIGAALIDVSPLMKYMIEGPDAARLLHQVTTRDIFKMAVGQVYYTGWCDDDGKLLDDGTVRAWASSASA